MRIRRDGGQAFTARGVAGNADNRNAAASQHAERGSDVFWIAGRHQNAVELLIRVRREDFYIALIEPGKGTEDEFDIDARQSRSGSANAGAQRIKEGRDLLREVNADAESAVQLQGTGGNIGLVSELLGLLQYAGSRGGTDIGRPMQSTVNGANRYAQSQRYVLNVRRFHQDSLEASILQHCSAGPVGLGNEQPGSS